ncbi:MAG: hypothetical protein IT307_11765 [Chloroflexi bacterium]|nr:hypothetical protein [Chloroflexota bacterium]
MNDIAPWYRLGYVTPHLFVDNHAYQFYRIAPPGAMLVTTNLDLADYTLEAVEHELPLFWRLAGILKSRGVDRIVWAGVPVAAVLGRTRMRAFLAEAEQRTGVPFSTDLEGVIAAMQHLGIKKAAIGTRWHGPVNDAVSQYLAEAGIEVVGRQSSGKSLAENSVLSPEEGMRLAVELGRQALRANPDADGLLLPGGLWLAIHAIPILEAEFGKPVILNLNASLWLALKEAGKQRSVQGWGRLLAGE